MSGGRGRAEAGGVVICPGGALLTSKRGSLQLSRWVLSSSDVLLTAGQRLGAFTLTGSLKKKAAVSQSSV